MFVCVVLFNLGTWGSCGIFEKFSHIFHAAYMEEISRLALSLVGLYCKALVSAVHFNCRPLITTIEVYGSAQ